MRSLGLILVLTLGMFVVVQGQTPLDAKLQNQLKQLFPSATSFSPKQPDPPHYKAFNGTNVIGFAFWTTELTPLERGYDGPIKILAGLDTRGVLTGILVVEHHEPYGDFSVDSKGFQVQFRGKDIRDPFKVGGDIDAISRATISTTTASRSVRNGARRLARALLTPPGGNTQ